MIIFLLLLRRNEVRDKMSFCWCGGAALSQSFIIILCDAPNYPIIIKAVYKKIVRKTPEFNAIVIIVMLKKDTIMDAPSEQSHTIE